MVHLPTSCPARVPYRLHPILPILPASHPVSHLFCSPSPALSLLNPVPPLSHPMSHPVCVLSYPMSHLLPLLPMSHPTRTHLRGEDPHALGPQLEREPPWELEGSRGVGVLGPQGTGRHGDTPAGPRQRQLCPTAVAGAVPTMSLEMFLRRTPAVKYVKAAELATNSVTASSSMGSCAVGSAVGRAAGNAAGTAEEGLCWDLPTLKNSPCADRRTDGREAQPGSPAPHSWTRPRDVGDDITLRAMSPCSAVMAGCPTREWSMAAKASSWVDAAGTWGWLGGVGDHQPPPTAPALPTWGLMGSGPTVGSC